MVLLSSMVDLGYCRDCLTVQFYIVDHLIFTACQSQFAPAVQSNANPILEFHVLFCFVSGMSFVSFDLAFDFSMGIWQMIK